MADANLDGNLLFGILALQNNFIDQADLIAAFHVWSADKTKPLGQVLVDRGALAKEEHTLVEVLVGTHLKKHGGDVRATLGAVADAAARDAIHSIDDAEIRQSISSLPPAAGYVMIETLLPPTGTEQRERYTLTRLHGKGGLGRVWLAHDTDLNRDVALKEILPDKAAHPEMWRRLLKEAQVAGQLEHPNIVPVYELARRSGDNQPFYTMRFVRGQTLGQAIANYHSRRAEGHVDPLQQPRLLQAFINVCQAIGYAHSRGVLHRDLKPENVVLGGFGEVLVLDWGLAKMVDRPDDDDDKDLASLSITDDAATEPTRMGQIHGTPAYMAPEQAEGRLDLIDSRTDIYGLGTILFETLTGSPPYRGQNLHELIYRIATGETPRARTTELSVPAALDAICAKAMAKERGDRYAKATELADDVQRWLADEPVSAYREGWSQHLARWSRRHRAWVQAGAASLVLVVLLTIGFAIQQNRSAERLRVEQARTKDALTKVELEQIKTNIALKDVEKAKNSLETANREVHAANADLKDALRQARQNAYAAHISLARREWDGTHVDRARELLANPDEAEFRGFEWYHLKRLYYVERLTLKGYSSFATGVAFSPAGERLASSGDSTLKLWDAATGQELLTLEGHTDGVMGVAFSPDGKRIASASMDQTIKLWDAATGQELLTLKGHSGSVVGVAFSPDSKRIASASSDQTIKLWNTATGQELFALKAHNRGVRTMLKFRSHTSEVTSVAFSPDGKRLASTSQNAIVTLWDVATGQELLTLEGHTDYLTSVAFSPDGRRLASASLDQTIKVWDAATGEDLGALTGHTNGVQSVAFSPDGMQIASASHDHTIKLWDAGSGQELLTLKGHSGSVVGVAFSPDSKRIASASYDKKVKFWDTAIDQGLLTLKGHSGSVVGVAFSPDGKRLASASADATVKLWDADSGQELRTLKGHTSQVLGVAFSPDGKRLASASADATVKLWDADSGQELRTLKGHTRAVMGVSFSPDGKRIASANDTVKLWDADSGQELRTLKGHTSGVKGVAFSPDGKRIASATYDGTIELWDVANGEELLILKGHTSNVIGVVFSPDGKRIASASNDLTVKIWLGDER